MKMITIIRGRMVDSGMQGKGITLYYIVYGLRSRPRGKRVPPISIKATKVRVNYLCTRVSKYSTLYSTNYNSIKSH